MIIEETTVAPSRGHADPQSIAGVKSEMRLAGLIADA
jgi:hypothetical protein